MGEATPNPGGPGQAQRAAQRSPRAGRQVLSPVISLVPPPPGCLKRSPPTRTLGQSTSAEARGDGEHRRPRALRGRWPHRHPRRRTARCTSRAPSRCRHERPEGAQSRLREGQPDTESHTIDPQGSKRQRGAQIPHAARPGDSGGFPETRCWRFWSRNSATSPGRRRTKGDTGRGSLACKGTSFDMKTPGPAGSH